MNAMTQSTLHPLRLARLPGRRTWLGLKALGACLVLAGCINITINFPSAEAEKAADRIVEQVYGKDAAPATPSTRAPGTTGAVSRAPEGVLVATLDRVLVALVPVAHAQAGADLNVSTPAIRALIAAMEARHASLEKYYASGAVGLTDDGMIAVRDFNLVPLPERNAVRKLVDDENADRTTLYGEIAQANGHAEWAADIRNTFAEKWTAKAKAGWYIRQGGAWKQR